jgi:hypothetical protein
MMPFFKQKSTLAIAILFILLASTVCSFASEVRASELTISQKGLAILSNVAAINIAQYNVESKQVSQKFSYFNALQEDVVSYNLTSSHSQMNVSCTFAKNKLHMLYVLDSEGTPALTKTASNVKEEAQNYLSDYTTYTQESIYTTLSDTLNKVDISKNSTLTLDNIKLKVNVTDDQRTTFSWIYTFNGVDAPEKCVAISYQRGALKFFVDTWDIYTVGGTNVNLSEKGAVDIALQSVKGFSYQLGFGKNATIVRNLNVTCAKFTQLIFCDSIGADNVRGDDNLTLFPMWRIGVGLDKWYPGNVYGVYVDVWADTGEVRLVQEVFSTLPPEMVGNSMFDNSSSVSLNDRATGSTVKSNSLMSVLGLSGLAFAVAVLVFASLRMKSKATLSLKGLPKGRFPKVITGVLCLLLVSVVFFVPISLVNADNTHGSLIFGDRSFGYPSTKPLLEVQYQDMVCSLLSNMFSASGYTTNNFQGSGSTKANVLSQVATSTVYGYDKNVVVYFDHGIGSNVSSGTDGTGDDDGIWHYSVYGDDGHPIYDKDINNAVIVGPGKVNFALINTCMSAGKTAEQYTYDGSRYYYGSSVQGINYNGYAVGMPFAWTNRTVQHKDGNFNVNTNISDDGYHSNTKDSGDQCYIGFPLGSASLSQVVDEQYASHLYGWWVYYFYQYVLYQDISVNQALDLASMDMYGGQYFDQTCLYNNFTASWGPNHTNLDYNSKIAVFGNGDIHLYNWDPSPPPPESPSVTICAMAYYPSIEDEYYCNVPFTFGSYEYQSGYDVHELYLPYGVYSGSVPEIHEDSGFTFRLVSVTVDGVPASGNSFMVPAISGVVHISAFYGFQVNASASSGGSVSPSGSNLCYSEAHFNAVPDTNYVFSYWLLDSTYLSSSADLYFYPTGDCCLQAVFDVYVPPPSGNGTFTIDAHDFQQNPVSTCVWVDDVFVGYSNEELTASYGYHTVTVEVYAGEHQLWGFDNEPVGQEWTTIYVSESPINVEVYYS